MSHTRVTPSHLDVVELRISAKDVNEYIARFTLYHRPFTSYPVDVFECILRHYNVIRNNHYYRTFDPMKEELVFVLNPYSDNPFAYLKYTFKDKLKMAWSILTR